MKKDRALAEARRIWYVTVVVLFVAILVWAAFTWMLVSGRVPFMEMDKTTKKMVLNFWFETGALVIGAIFAAVTAYIATSGVFIAVSQMEQAKELAAERCSTDKALADAVGKLTKELYHRPQRLVVTLSLWPPAKP